MRSIATLLVLLFVSAAAAEDGASPKLALGVNYTGLQVRYDLSPRTSLEAVYQSGKAGSKAGEVTSGVLGLRLYRFPGKGGRNRVYFGGELAALSGDVKKELYATTGFAAGAFVGIEACPSRRFAIGVDAGPYLIALKETSTKLNSSGVDFVLNTYAILYLF